MCVVPVMQVLKARNPGLVVQEAESEDEDFEDFADLM